MWFNSKECFCIILIFNSLDGSALSPSLLPVTPDGTISVGCNNTISSSTLVHLMKNCAINSVDSSFFTNLPKLKKLEMNKCSVNTVTSGAFSNLDELVLSSSYFQDIQLPFCGTDHHLQILSIRGTELGDIVEINRLFSSCDHLQYLSLNEVDVARVEDVILKNKNLSDLDLAQNNIRSLEEESFASLRLLNSLSLSDNQISTIAKTAFSGLTSLQHLRLDQNNLLTLPDSVFDDLQSLKTLNLSGNSLSQLQRLVFENVHHLQRLLVAENDIQNIDQLIFSSYDSLKELDLSGNNIESLAVDLFVGLSNLKLLKLNKNNIKNIQPRVFSPLSGLEVLDLSSNSLETISGEPFTDNNSALKSLDVSINNIKYLQPHSFYNFANLHKLNLSFNELQTVPSELFGKRISLEFLDLSHNNIYKLDGPAVRVTTLHIHSNRLTHLSESWYKSRLLSHVTLARNPWQCKCLQMMRIYFKDKVMIGDQNMLSGKNPVCVVFKNSECIENDDTVKNYEDIVESFIESLSE